MVHPSVTHVHRLTNTHCWTEDDRNELKLPMVKLPMVRMGTSSTSNGVGAVPAGEAHGDNSGRGTTRRRRMYPAADGNEIKVNGDSPPERMIG
jgi:hypothetical protein